MQDFNGYVKNQGSNSNQTGKAPGAEKQNLINLVTQLASKYDGKNTSELISAIYNEAKKGKQNGTLTNGDIDNFATLLSPMLDAQKRKMLYKITDELKRI